MNIKTYIQNQILIPRIQKKEVLAVYDPDRIYHDICLEMETEELKVADAGKSSITAREDALKALKNIGENKLKGLLIYIPAKKPETDEQKMADPFSIYLECGSVFPDGAGDEYMQICLKAKPDHSTEIRRIFTENPSPSFPVIDALGKGKQWPNLQVELKAESAVDILSALLCPDDEQKKALNEHDGWVAEAKDLFNVCLGLKLITRGKTWSSISNELWRFILFSEFAFDLPENLPESLANVPKANDEARPLIENLCDRLRNDKRTQSVYIERAEAIEKELNLPACCKSIKDLGRRDTFPFEEKFFLMQGIDALKKNETDKVQYIIDQHTDTVWSGIGESQAKWGLVKASLALCRACEDCLEQLPEHSRNMETLINFYTASLHKIDRLQREFEQSVSDIIDNHSAIDEMIEKARKAYAKISSSVHDIFIRHLEKTGWPPLGSFYNADVFDTLIAPKLMESGYKTAFFMIDSLRYELGTALKKQLEEDDAVDFTWTASQLPSITSTGMAGLLPRAGRDLYLTKKDNKIIPVLDSSELTNVKQRMEVLQTKYGSRFKEMKLADFVRSRKKLPGDVHLLVLRGTEIDSHLETSAETTLQLIHDTLRRIRFAVNKLKSLGFNEAVIATDHGFFLNMQAEPGDVCTKPLGDWIFTHNRMALGSGTPDSSSFIMPANQLGIKGEFEQAGGPRGLVPYRAGELYFHGGASLQECILPVITIHLSKQHQEQERPEVTLKYKNNAKHITTRFPVIDVFFEKKQMEMFSDQNDTELLIEAHDKKGSVVGEARAGGSVNPSTGIVNIKPGHDIKVTLRMQDEFEGSFVVKAMNPVTFTVYCKLELKTDYLV